jgi:pre-mRNA-splicing factor CWC26
MSGTKADAILARTETSSSSSVRKKNSKSKSNAQASHSRASALQLLDDDPDWGLDASARIADEEEHDQDVVIVSSDRSFKKRRGNNGELGGGWQSARGTSTPAPDDQSILMEEDAQSRPTPVGGIVSKEQLALIQGPAVTKDLAAPEQETVYRDASGRRIDTKAERAAEARARRLREDKEAQKMEWGKGVVQREEEERRRRELELEKTRDVARFVAPSTVIQPI